MQFIDLDYISMLRERLMTKQCARVVVLLTLAVLTPVCADSGNSDNGCTYQSAVDFIRNLYVGYATGKPTPNPTDSQSRIFSESTLALIRKDQKVQQGEMGVLDYDPICDCQDYENIHDVVVMATRSMDGGTKVTARFFDGGVGKTVRFDIVSESGKCRIYDIHGSLAPSLRNLLDPR